MRRLVLVTLLFWLTLSLVSQCHGENETNIYTFDIPCYAPARITINYGYTNNVSITDISTLGQSMYTYTGGPTQIEFRAEDVDTYTFTATINYENASLQTITVGVWSGTAQPMQGYTIEANLQSATFHVTLRVSEEPHFPTEEEVARAAISQVAEELKSYYEQSRQLTQGLSQTMVMVSIYTVISAVVSLISLLIVAVLYRTIKRGVET